MGLGGGYALWGVWYLGWQASLGLGDELVTGGPYRLSRHPQYVGDMILLPGYALLCNSGLALIAALIGSAWFALLPVVEEPWLRRQYGQAYENYRAHTPRLLFPSRSWRR